MADELPIKKLTPEELEREWYENVYQGDSMPQLTMRSVIMGSILGAVLSLQNLYVGLKTGWGLGVAITSCILSFTIWKSLRKAFPRWVKTDMSILENNAMQSTASSAGYSTGGTIVSAISAYLLVNGVHIGYGLLSAWIFFLAVLGVTMAIPMKRQMINIERLKFPSGIAAAETLKSLHGVGHDGGESKSASLLFKFGGVGIAIAAVRDLFGWLPALYNTFGSRMAMYTVQFDASMILVGAGALMGMRVCVSILIGALINWVFLAPAMMDRQVIAHPLPYIRSTQDLQFPLTMPAGHALGFEIEMAKGDYLIEDGSEKSKLVYTWPQATTYQSLPELAKALNSPRTADGSTNPFFGNVRVMEPEDAYLRKRLEMRVDSALKGALYAETSLTILDSIPGAAAAGSILSLKSGASNTQSPGGFRNIVSWSLWGGAACMVTSGLLAFIFEWRTALRAFSGLKSIFRRNKRSEDEDPLERIEVPGTWFAGGMIIGTIGIVGLASVYFNVPWWMALLAVFLSFFLALVACRACGETDTTPVGAMGKITQLTFGAIAPKQMNTNLMSACITAGVADSASDLLTDLKSGYVLGANARKQFLAQFAGIFIGTAVTVPAFFLVVPDVSILGSTKFPAPAAQVWASVARLLSNGLESLHPTARAALVIGGIVGLLIPMCERLFPKYQKWIPSAMGLGLAFVLPFYNALSMFIGGVIALVYGKLRPALAEQYTVASASGIIAGESLMGIFITLLGALGMV
ncbi:MAG: OPT/YSL family transporter [bacterium]|nr:OPT/YSL family transporter [bacterium]